MSETPEHLPVDENKLIAERREKLKALRGQGIAFPNDFTVGSFAGDLKTEFADAERWTAEAIDAKLPYREPPAWHQPIEAAIGAALLKADRPAAARAAFERALVRRPGSPWALWGRAQAEAALGDSAASTATLAQVDRLWKGDRAMLRLDRL